MYTWARTTPSRSAVLESFVGRGVIPKNKGTEKRSLCVSTAKKRPQIYRVFKVGYHEGTIPGR